MKHFWKGIEIPHLLRYSAAVMTSLWRMAGGKPA